jgi:hypothetical protein
MTARACLCVPQIDHVLTGLLDLYHLRVIMSMLGTTLRGLTEI